MKLTELTSIDQLLHEESMNLWEMANLRPDFTNLPVTVWVSSGESARHGPRIKVCRGGKWKPTECSTIPLTGVPRVTGQVQLSQEEFAQIVSWLHLNQEALMQFWSGDIEYTQDLLPLLKPYVA